MKDQEPTTTERKPYAEPQLVEYGDLETLTQFLPMGGDDGDGGSIPT
jgi:hypothetical protein